MKWPEDVLSNFHIQSLEFSTICFIIEQNQSKYLGFFYQSLHNIAVPVYDIFSIIFVDAQNTELFENLNEVVGIFFKFFNRTFITLIKLSEDLLIHFKKILQYFEFFDEVNTFHFTILRFSSLVQFITLKIFKKVNYNGIPFFTIILEKIVVCFVKILHCIQKFVTIVTAFSIYLQKLHYIC